MTVMRGLQTVQQKGRYRRAVCSCRQGDTGCVYLLGEDDNEQDIPVEQQAQD
jgi:hypothetical protein